MFSRKGEYKFVYFCHDLCMRTSSTMTMLNDCFKSNPFSNSNTAYQNSMVLSQLMVEKIKNVRDLQLDFAYKILMH